MMHSNRTWKWMQLLLLQYIYILEFQQHGGRAESDFGFRFRDSN